MTTEKCTAVIGVGEVPPNVLFVPPCMCPNCAPDRTYEPRTGDDGWLRVRGHQQRYRVEVITLGELGRAVLG